MVEASAARAIHLRLTVCPKRWSREKRPGRQLVAAAGVEEAVRHVGGPGDRHSASDGGTSRAGRQAQSQEHPAAELTETSQDGVVLPGTREA